jgi:hypothetical protein
MDTGSTGHYFPDDIIAVSSRAILDIKPSLELPIQVSLPDESIIRLTHTCRINIPALPPDATTGHLFPNMGPVALLSIGKLCDAGCEAHFQASECQITYQDEIILTGTRNITTNNLWHLNTSPPTATTS